MRFNRRQLFAAVAGTLASAFGASKARAYRWSENLGCLTPGDDTSRPPCREMFIESINYETMAVKVKIKIPPPIVGEWKQL